MGSALEDVAAAADAVADDQRNVARQARWMQQLRDRGWSWSKILDEEGAPGLLTILRKSTRTLTAALGQLAHTVAHSLAAEGESRRQIAQRLGVTHQRVSAMLLNGGRYDGDTASDDSSPS
jgi:hypothetical protein